MPTVSVIIPNWNGLRFLETCLRSLSAQTFEDFDILLVDNGSQDASVAFVQSMFPQVQLINFSENQGFSAAVNAGIARASGRYLFVLNNDTELSPSCLAALVEGIEMAPDIGAVGPKILDFGDRTLLGGIGDGYTFAGVPYSVGFLERDQGQWNQVVEIFSPSGCAAFYRRAALEEVGTFDEDFFAYYEDVDLGFRLQMARARCLYVPSAVVYHIGSGTTGGRLNPFTLRQMAQNMINLAIKNLPGLLLLRVFPVWFGIQAILLSRVVALHRETRSTYLTAYGQGFRAGLRMLPRMLEKRRMILGRSRLSTHELSHKIKTAEGMILDSLLRQRGVDWTWAPLVRFYRRVMEIGLS